VTSFSFTNGPAAESPILQLKRLIPVVKNMPKLQFFDCIGCNAQPSRLQLLSGLPYAAPNIEDLVLIDSGLTGQLPPTWGNWPSISSIMLGWNSINGTLPDSFSLLPNMTWLDLNSNKLQGTLPNSWGQAWVVPKSMRMDLHGNSSIRGEVPSSWVHFSEGEVDHVGTQVGGCAPNGLTLRQEPALPTCSSVSSDAAALQAIQGLLERSGLSNSGLGTWIIGE
jgi:hypothetical protein